MGIHESVLQNMSVEQLREEIKKHDNLYWKEQNPIISDPDYDRLVRRLQELEPDDSLVSEFKEEEVTSSGKIEHENPMLSLDKVYTSEEVLKWCRKVARTVNECFLLQIKYDGCSAELDNDILSTRGDGHIGEDISDKIPHIRILTGPDFIPAIGFEGKIRGELVLQKSVFLQYKDILKRKSGEPYKNSRNACAGILNTDDFVSPVKEPFLTFVPFDNYTMYKTLKQMEDFILSGEWDKFVKDSENLDYPADGLVIKLEDQSYCKELGMTKHHRKSELAFKFANPSAKTVLKGVTLSCGKGCVTPIGNVEPVELGGVTVSNVNLHNWKNILDMGIFIGDTLIVERAGDVIPYVVGVIPAQHRVAIEMDYCPVCHGPLTYEEPVKVCKNPECGGSNLRKLSDSVVRIGIERLGRPTLKDMMKIIGVVNLIDIFHLTEDDLLRLPRFGKRKAQNLLEEIDKVKKNGVYEWQILSAMNIPGIGSTLSEKILEVYNLRDLIFLCRTEPAISELTSLDGIEVERASILVDGVLDNKGYLLKLLSILPIKEPKKKDSKVVKICFSGKFPDKKKVYYQMLEGKNFEIMEKVDKTLDILVVADSTKNSGKQQKAEKLGIKVLELDSLLTSIK